MTSRRPLLNPFRLKAVACIASESRSCGWKPPEGLCVWQLAIAIILGFPKQGYALVPCPHLHPSKTIAKANRLKAVGLDLARGTKEALEIVKQAHIPIAFSVHPFPDCP